VKEGYQGKKKQHELVLVFNKIIW